jgi:hypothetical protein
MAEWGEGHLQESGGQSGLGVTTPGEVKPSWGSLLAQTYGLYRRRFWAFFRMALLPALLAYSFGQVARLWLEPLRIPPLRA